MSKLVAVHSSDPKYGDPYEGVFFMQPPYDRADVRQHADQSGRRWVKKMAGGGLVMTEAPKLRGPFPFTHTERHDMTETHYDEDEYVIVGWFKRDRPLILSMEEIEHRRELALRYGYSPEAPMLTGRGDLTPKRGKTVADEMDEYREAS